jgi:hypothetical protein
VEYWILLSGGAKGLKQGGGTGQNGRKAENVCCIGFPLLFSKIFYLLPKFSGGVPTGELVLLLSILVFQEDFPVTFAPK